MKMQVAFLLSIFATISQCHGGWVNVNDKLEGRIIHVEALRGSGWRGHWLDSRNWGLRYSGSPEREIYFKSWTQFLVKKCDHGTVCLESMYNRDHYMDAHTSGWAKVSHTNYPNDKNWAQWKIECQDGGLDVCRFFAVRWGNQNKFLDAHHSGWAAVSSYGGHSKFRIVAPTPEESYKVITVTNGNGLPTPYIVKYTVGIEKSNEVTNTITTAVSVEIEKAFVAASLSLSYEWSQTMSTTFSASEEHIIEVTALPFTKVEVKQLQGKYGPFEVKSSHYVITCHDMRTDKPCIDTPQVTNK